MGFVGTGFVRVGFVGTGFSDEVREREGRAGFKGGPGDDVAPSVSLCGDGRSGSGEIDRAETRRPRLMMGDSKVLGRFVSGDSERLTSDEAARERLRPNSNFGLGLVR